jgi:dipeptidyl aminopeptidase/acylaminoacyl peptidase
MAYLSQRDGFSFDLWLADAHTGKVKKRLVESARDASFESLRYMNSGAAFSADGRFIAFAAKSGGQDALYVYDLNRGKVTKRLKFDLNGIMTPTWSPDGSRVAFTGLDGGVSDLFVTDLDGKLTRLTRDRYADLMPTWSPDGSTIAFTTDRETTDLDVLMYGNMRVGLIDVASRHIEVLPLQDGGKNINPMWSPDGRKLIWVSDRAGTNNLYLFDRDDRSLSRITDLLSGVIAVTPLSAVISWSRQGRLLFTYFEKAGYNTYVVEDPLSLPRSPVRATAVAGNGADAAAGAHTQGPPPAPPASTPPDSAAVTATPSASNGIPASRGFVTSYYRATDGAFRPSDDAPVDANAPAPVSVIALLDSSALALPDTTSFEHGDYKAKLSADFIGRPSLSPSPKNEGLPDL